MEDVGAVVLQRVGVVGSGLIGRCWAVLFARAGCDVMMFDIEEKQLEAAKVSILETLTELHENGLLKGKVIEDVAAKISFCTNLSEAVNGADYVQECVPEILELKQKVFSQLDELASSSCILASSTSCISPSQFTNSLKHQAHCIVAHPVNPPHYIPVVELVPAPWTSPDTVQRTKKIQLWIGQAPVVLNKEVNGFIINRLQYALLMEAWRLVEDGVASPADIDVAVSCGLGLRWSFMGPFQTIDLNAPEGVLDYMNRYGETITGVCKEQTDVRNMKGTKTTELVHDEMRKEVPMEALKDGSRKAWRDNRLAALAVHKFKQNQVESKQ
eukprot:m.10290 g.10290  ORF g.10290 m.10290 type:complete len:328 (-) comp3648_c0_seq1:2581-3564(-)